MKTTINSKLVRKCLILAVMILGLVYVASSDRYSQPVMAMPCCEQCPGGGDQAVAEDECGYGCTGQVAVYGGSWEQCFSSCMNRSNQCYGYCRYCNSNVGPGEECTSTSDCPMNYFCAASNSCERFW
jgi:hypothetical protein